MESFKILACFTFLAVCALAADQLPTNVNVAPGEPASANLVREKKQALLPVTAYNGYYTPYASYPYAYGSYAYDDGKYYPGKYEKPYLYRSFPAAAAAAAAPAPYYNYPGYYYY